MNPIDYLNIPYKHLGRDIQTGVDCYGLVIAIYKTELGITLPDYHYAENWSEQGFDYIKENYWEKFAKVKRAKIYGIVTFRDLESKAEVHMGIMTGSNSFLHVPHNGVSMIGNLTQRVWRRAFGSFYIYDRDKI